jgi:transposase InsO family protein
MNNPPGVYNYSRNAIGIARAEEVMRNFGPLARRLSPTSVEILVDHPLPAPARKPIGTPARPFIRVKQLSDLPA